MSRLDIPIKPHKIPKLPHQKVPPGATAPLPPPCYASIDIGSIAAVPMTILGD